MFKLVLFLVWNGCAPHLIAKWIMLTQFWSESTAKAEKMTRQVDFVLNNADSKRSSWFYYDFDYQKLLWLNGLPK